MKWLRAALIALIVFIAASSFSNYQEQLAAQRQRQELLYTFNDVLQGKNDLQKSDLSPLEKQGDIVSPNIIKKDSELIMQAPEANKKDNAPISKFNVLGRIIIDKISIDYPILDITTPESLNISITWFCGSGINKPGNCIIAGHNKNDGSMFGNLKKLAPGDTIKLYDSTGSMQQYKIFDTYIVEPTDLSPLDQETEGKKILTLITCSNKGKQRLIVKGIEE